MGSLYTPPACVAFVTVTFASPFTRSAARAATSGYEFRVVRAVLSRQEPRESSVRVEPPRARVPPLIARGAPRAPYPARRVTQPPRGPRSQPARAALQAGSTSTSSAGSEGSVTVTGGAEEQLSASAAVRTLGAAESEQSERFEWSRAWYAVGVAADMDASRPHALTVVGRPLVLWRDASLSWRCFLDQCPHRLVPLSEGRIDAEGRLACSYHGWAFAGSGACQLIPQAAPELPGQPPRALASPRACATAFPVKEMHGVLFVWPDKHSAHQAESTPLPLPNGVDFNEYTVFPAYSRVLPYGFEFLGENLADPSHFPFAHHGVGTTTREQGGPMKAIAVAESGAAGFHGPFHMESSELPSDFAFQAPQLVVYTYYLKQQQPKFPFFKSKAEAAAAPPNAFKLCLYMTPSAPGSSIVVSLQMLRRGDGKKMGFPLPPWSVHLRQHQIYDGDAYFLHCQERTLQHREQQQQQQQQQQQGAQGESKEGESEQGAGSGRGSGWRAFYMPTSSDLFVVAFRQWLAKYAGGAVAYPPAFSGVSLPPQPAPKEVVLDRMASHTAHCTSCSSALATLQRAHLLLPALSLLAAAAAAASTSLRARVPLALLAVAAALAAWKAQEFAKEFEYTGWDHARKD
ncbi:unnamed protein product [Closterium sp. Yama58-4]|nr:unnamed protein product [Closterium sp. Yama58-4]